MRPGTGHGHWAPSDQCRTGIEGYHPQGGDGLLACTYLIPLGRDFLCPLYVFDKRIGCG